MRLESDSFPKGIFLSPYDVARPVNWREQFGNAHPLHLEIGFGLGEFLIRRAEFSPRENFIGLEQDWPRIYKCMQKVSALRRLVGNAAFGENLRILRIDAVVAFQRLFAPRGLDTVTCLFPCPWPKKDHVKYRLFSRDFFCLLNSRMKDGAGVRIVTDWQPYFDWMKDELGDSGFAARTAVVPPQFGTKFERKWREGGQEKFWELQLTKLQHRDVPVEEDCELKVYFLKDFDPGHFRFENVTGDVSVILKDFIFDPRQNTGLARLIVAEKFLTQHVWAVIVKRQDHWCVAKADGHSALPTKGVALALEQVYQAARKSVEVKE